MPVDPRENILASLRIFKRQNYRDFNKFYNLSIGFLQNPNSNAKEFEEVLEVDDMIYEFRRKFRGKEVPSLAWVLAQMDRNMMARKSIIECGNRYKRRRVRMIDADIWVEELEQDIWVLINRRIKDMRIVNQQLV